MGFMLCSVGELTTTVLFSGEANYSDLKFCSVPVFSCSAVSVLHGSSHPWRRRNPSKQETPCISSLALLAPGICLLPLTKFLPVLSRDNYHAYPFFFSPSTF